MVRFSSITLILFLGSWLVFSCSGIEHDHTGMSKASAAEESSQPILYRCSMHPDQTSDKPGKCPICGMTMDEVKESDGKQQEHTH